MKTTPLEVDLSSYTVTLPHDDFLPKDAPREKLDLMIHHAQFEAQERAYRIIERETGFTRDELVCRWNSAEGTSVCVFAVRDPSIHGPAPGISMIGD